MSIDYHYKDNIVTLVLCDMYSINELKDNLIKALDDPQCPENAVLLMDMRQDQSVQKRSSEEIREMSYFFEEIRDRISRRMCMVTSDLLAFGLMNMAKVYDRSRGINTHAFTNMADAMNWLTSDEEE